VDCRDRRARGEKAYVNALKALVLKVSDKDILSLEGNPCARAPLRGEEPYLADRERPLLEDIDELPANNACCACNGYIVCLFKNLPLPLNPKT
jgi:hypothetical protein